MSLMSGICLNGYMFCNCRNWRSSFLIIFVCKWKWRLFVQKYVAFEPCGKNRSWHNLPWKFTARFSSCSCLGHRQAARRILMSPLWCCRTLLLGGLRVLQKKKVKDSMKRCQESWKIHHILMTGGGNSNISYFHPENWGRFPFWLIFLKWVGSTTTWFSSWCQAGGHRYGDLMWRYEYSCGSPNKKECPWAWLLPDTSDSSSQFKLQILQQVATLVEGTVRYLFGERHEIQ